MTDRDTDLAGLRAELANPANTVVSRCPACEYRFAFRAWPDMGAEAREACLDGLGKVAEALGVNVFGMVMLEDPGDFHQRPRPGLPVQLWSANDRRKLLEGTWEGACERLLEHQCPAGN